MNMIGELAHQINAPYIEGLDHLKGHNWRASEASETPSIATYRKKCLGVSMSKPQCACSQFYVKRRSGRACIYDKPACCSRVQLRINGNHFLVICIGQDISRSGLSSHMVRLDNIGNEVRYHMHTTHH